jgi:non-ribosomal peptide synthetase component F
MPPLRIQYKDYAEWQTRQTGSTKMVEAKKYWSQKFAHGMHAMRLLTDKTPPVIRTYAGASLSLSLHGSSSQVLSDIASNFSVSKYCVALTFVKVLLYKYTGQKEILVGSPISGRDHQDLERLVGIFLNILPLSTQLSHADSFANALEKVKTTLFEAYRFQYYPFDCIVEDSYSATNSSASSAVNVLVQMNGQDILEQQEFRDLSISLYPFEQEVSQYDLTFFFSESEHGMNMRIEYQTELFVHSTVERIANELSALITSVGKNIEIPIEAIAFDEEFIQNESLQFIRSMESVGD